MRHLSLEPLLTRSVPVAPRALNPERGGSKNLLVLSTLPSDWEDEKNWGLAEKPHLVIVGGGWDVRLPFTSLSPMTAHATGTLLAVGVLEKLTLRDYHVTIISPETYTTFTPLLPCASNCSSGLRIQPIPVAAAVGTVSVRSLVESL